MLLDTQVILWGLVDTDRLSAVAAEVIESRQNELVASVVSAWETAIKASSGRLLLREGLEGFRELLRRWDASILPITFEHIQAVMQLAFHHRDPFDRMLVAQSLVEGLPIVTADRRLAAYGVEVIW